MSKPITEKKIQEQIKSIEQQYNGIQADIDGINKKGDDLMKLLNVKLQEAMNVKGQYKALVSLLPKKSQPKKKELSIKAKKK